MKEEAQIGKHGIQSYCLLNSAVELAGTARLQTMPESRDHCFCVSVDAAILAQSVLSVPL